MQCLPLPMLIRPPCWARHDYLYYTALLLNCIDVYDVCWVGARCVLGSAHAELLYRVILCLTEDTSKRWVGYYPLAYCSTIFLWGADLLLTVKCFHLIIFSDVLRVCLCELITVSDCAWGHIPPLIIQALPVIDGLSVNHLRNYGLVSKQVVLGALPSEESHQHERAKCQSRTVFPRPLPT